LVPANGQWCSYLLLNALTKENSASSHEQ